MPKTPVCTTKFK